MTLNSRCSQLQSIIQQQPLSSSANYQPLSSNSLYSLLETGLFTNKAYNESVAQTSEIWIALAVITFCIYIIFISNTIWLRKCPDKSTGIWSWCRPSTSRKRTKIFLAAGLVLCTIALGASIAGAIAAGSNQENGDKAACALIDFFGQVKNGSVSGNWGGTEKSLLSYQRIAARLSTEVDAIHATFSTDSNEMDAKIAEYQNDLNYLAKNKANYKVKSARFDSDKTVEPDFVADLGPISESGTYLNLLKVESDALGTAIKKNAQGLNTEIPHLKSKSASYQESATKAAENYEVFVQPISDASQSIADYVYENYDNWGKINTGVVISLGANVVLFAVILASVLYNHKFQSPLAIKFAYAAWNCLMILTAVNAILASQVQEVKKRSSEQCDLFNLVSKDLKYIDALGKQYTSETTEALKLCFFGSGNAYEAMGFSEGGYQIGKIGSYIRDTEPYLYNVNGTVSKELAAQKAIIDMYIQGLLPAYSDKESEESTVTNLDLFNSYSNSAPAGNKQKELAHCSVSRDEWVLNLTNCTATRFIPAFQPSESFRDSICLGILSLDAGTISQRYQDSSFAGCGLVNGDKIADILVNQYHGLNAHFEDLRIKFGQLKKFYDNNLRLKYNEILKAAGSITEPIQDFNKSFSGLLQFVTSPEDGILYNSNCSFFKSGLSTTNSFVCEAASSVDKTFIAQIISVVCGALGCVFVYLYLRKLEGTFKLITDEEDSRVERVRHKEMDRLDASNKEDDDLFEI